MQKLDLDREPGDFYAGTGLMLLVGESQPAAIAHAITDEGGSFVFTTTRDRGRWLTIRLARVTPGDFRSPAGYKIEGLRDSLAPSPHVAFESRLIHQKGGGFGYLP